MSGDIVGVIPAAGYARRMPGLAGSKEVLPVRDPRYPEEGERSVTEHLLARMAEAGADRAFLVLRDGKWDIPATLGDGSAAGVRIAYLTVHRPDGAAYTVAQAAPFVAGSLVLLGFPDLFFEPRDALVRLVEHQTATGADVVLGLFPSDRPTKMDMVKADLNGRVRAIHIKPASTELRFAWALALWTPAFTRFLTAYLVDLDQRAATTPLDREIHVGEPIREAIASGLFVSSVTFPDGRCLDLGTPEDLARLPEFGKR